MTATGSSDIAANRQWQTAVGTGTVRIAAGLALLRWRDRIVRLCGGVPTDRTVRSVFTYFGVRDIALGASALLATRPGADVSKQVTVQGLADTADTAILAALLRMGKLSRIQGSAAAALAAATAATNFATSYRLGRVR